MNTMLSHNTMNTRDEEFTPLPKALMDPHRGCFFFTIPYSLAITLLSSPTFSAPLCNPV